MYWGRPPIPPENPMYGYAQHMMSVTDYVILLLWVVIIMKVFMIVVLTWASWSFVKWRRTAERQVETDLRMTESVRKNIDTTEASVRAVREMVITVQEFLSLARGWAASAEGHEHMAKLTTLQAKTELNKATAEVKEEVRAVPDATALKVVELVKSESGVIDRGKSPPLPPETDEIDIEPGKAPLG